MINFFKWFSRKREHRGDSPMSVSNNKCSEMTEPEAMFETSTTTEIEVDFSDISFHTCIKRDILSLVTNKNDNAHGVDTSGTVFSRTENELSGPLSNKVVKTLKFVCISDTHSEHHKMKHTIPDGDVLIHAGDFTLLGLQGEVDAFNKFIGSLPHKYKIVIAGNHERCLNLFETSVATGTFPDEHVQCNEQMRKHSSISKTRKLLSNCIYLQDEVKEIDGIRIYGSPWTIEYGTGAFACDSTTLQSKWDAIPTDVDILITHSPPYGYGTFQTESTLFVNASICTKGYDPVNKPVIFELEITPGDGNKNKVSVKFDKSCN